MLDICLLAEAAAVSTSTNNLLISAIVALAGAIVALFWQLQKSNQKNVEAYKIVAPLVSKLVEVVEELQPLLKELSEKKKD